MLEPDAETKQAIDEANKRAWELIMHNPQEALSIAGQALDTAVEASYTKGQADAFLNLGWSRYYLSRLPEAYKSFLDAQGLYDLLGDAHGLCMTANAFGVYHHSIFRLDKSMVFYRKSLEIAKANRILDRELIAMVNLGELCLEIDDYKDALDYLIPAYSRMNKNMALEMVADCLKNIGKAFLSMQNLTMAEAYTRKSYTMTMDSDNLIQSADTLEILANVIMVQGDLETANATVEQALELVKRTGNVSQRASLLIVQGEINNSLRRPEEAIVVLKEAEDLCKRIKLSSKVFKAHEQISRAYEALGDFAKALLYYKRFSDFRAQVQHEESASRLSTVQMQSEIDGAQQEAEIYRLRNIDLKGKTEELEDYNRQIMSISDIGRRVTASLDYGMVVQTLYDGLKPFLDMDMFGIALYDPDRDMLVYSRYYEDDVRKHNMRIKLNSDTSFSVWAFKNREAVLIEDKNDEYTKYLSKPPSVHGRASQSIVCLPLSIEDRMLGILMLQNYKPHAYTAKHLSLLQALSPYISIAVENSIIHDSLEDLNRALSDEKRRLERATLKISHLANHDTLTGLPNRRLLFELMDKSLETARRTGGKVGIAFIDLDDFKPINDAFGHAAGDSALVAISDRIRSLVRASDIVARIGGDEFVAVITNIKDRQDIEKVAVKMLKECSKPLLFMDKTCSIGMSMGIAVFPDDGESIEDLVNKADAAMYSVKHKQKNAYEFCS